MVKENREKLRDLHPDKHSVNDAVQKNQASKSVSGGGRSEAAASGTGCTCALRSPSWRERGEAPNTPVLTAAGRAFPLLPPWAMGPGLCPLPGCFTLTAS